MLPIGVDIYRVILSCQYLGVLGRGIQREILPLGNCSVFNHVVSNLYNLT